ncbi:MAG: type IX secretion system membrane protein PorP/SprF, partial [Bacteroidota bacterium]
ILTIGGQFGSIQRRLDQAGLRFEDELGPNGGSSSLDRSGLMDRANFTDLAGGILFKSKLNKTTTLELGASVSHLTTPDYSLLGGGTGGGSGVADLPLGIIIHGRYNVDLSKKWLMSPAFFYQTLGPADEMAVQVWGGYRLDDKREKTLRFGTAYRLRDAAKILLGFDYKDLRVGFAYDINLSDLTKVTNTVGAFEIAANYIIKIYKQPDVKPVLLCPRL